MNPGFFCNILVTGGIYAEMLIVPLIEGKRVLAPKKDLIEVNNAIKLYDDLRGFTAYPGSGNALRIMC